MKTRKRLLWLLLIPAALALLYFVSASRTGGPEKIGAQLLVNGEAVGGEQALTIYRDPDTDEYCVELPLIAVIEGLGYDVNWEADGSARMEIKSETYLLRGNTISNRMGRIIHEDDGEPAAETSPDGLPNELYYPRETLQHILNSLSIPVTIRIDPEGRTVSVRALATPDDTAEEGGVPLIGKLRVCGITVTRIDADTATFSWDGTRYLIDIPGMTLCEEGDSFNYIMPPPGSDGVSYRHSEDEIYVDQSTMESILFMLGIEPRRSPSN